ncbi:5'-nucleotidase [Vibrio sp. SS-MA-C1-2]|uniref:5'-nucleotidase n=1 Tax=Vibrio sp. SS-MA-C1-2 TaxID=2908646 RepID=UPI001F2035C8|nr:5'-nucleotidase [Vibrio sp. SS-MA-C1-2]UJF17738.1 5'-nucleotidase [Vibrio sp. SS-MA-C1-2]
MSNNDFVETINDKLVVAVTSSALFDQRDGSDIFINNGTEAFEKYQEERVDTPLKGGPAFNFVKKLLSLNHQLGKEVVEVVVLSKNSVKAGRRVFRSIEHYKLPISRAVFLSGGEPHDYIPAFNVSLFLSTNRTSIDLAINKGFPAGLVLNYDHMGDSNGDILKLAFDFDGVVVDDESESVYKKGDLDKFQNFETKNANISHSPGPLAKFFKQISWIQQLESQKESEDPNYKKVLRTSIVTARGAPAHERVITTLYTWGVFADETFFLAGLKKARIFETLKPDMFFDDQMVHLDADEQGLALVHIPYGIANNKVK